jgi:hypothetical protein
MSHARFNRARTKMNPIAYPYLDRIEPGLCFMVRIHKVE